MTSSTRTEVFSTRSETSQSPRDSNIVLDSAINHVSPLIPLAAKTQSTSQISKNGSSITIKILLTMRAAVS